MNQTAIFNIIRESISQLQGSKTKPLRVAVNGIEGSGKTTFAERLTAYLISHGFHAIHVSIDGFHYHREHRYRQGKDSAKGYYEDSYDELTFAEKVLKASQTEQPTYLPASHDLETDQYLNLLPVSIPSDSILITDGAYLFKPIYREHWDLKIYLRTNFGTARSRGVNRDKDLLGGPGAAADKYNQRYHAASKIYIAENDPEKLADIIIDNTDFVDLVLVKENH